ncbi:MAG TPA: FAD-dependent oxidoreductase [Roseimicrobium sp.]|nr:FAD-dependent oxidoreductase [Roseimicrobium sp.]
MKDQRPWTYEPHVAEMIFNDLVREAGVEVFLGQWLVKADQSNRRLNGFTTQRGDTFRAKIFVDASYEGDLLPAAKVSYTVGREGKKQYGESFAGHQFPKKPVAVSPFAADGSLLPLMTARDAGKDDGDEKIMAYSFRLSITTNEAKRVAIKKPANYDPAQFELHRRFLKANPNNRLLFDIYPLPNGIADANNSIGGQISFAMPGASWAWPDAGWDQRMKIFQQHKDYTQGLLWFLGNDPDVPERLRKEMQQWGLVKDEFAKFDHWPPVLYVREGRRMIGDYIFTQSDVLTNITKPDSVAVGSFPIDSHDCQRIPTADGGFINEGTIFPVRLAIRKIGQPHQIPYRSLTPKASECENLLVPVALSCSHVAISSIRVEPTWMTLGQSAGIAAAMAVKKNVAVQKLPYADLRGRLLAQKQVLDLHEIKPLPEAKPAGAMGLDSKSFPGIVLDDTDAVVKGAWDHSTNFRPYIGTGYLSDGNSDKGGKELIFTPAIPKTGLYDLRIAYSAHATRATNVLISVENGGQRQSATFNQQTPLPKEERFRSAGQFNFTTGTNNRITIRNIDTEGFVIVDAVQLIPASK